jgi:hypothetical protein
MHQPLHAPPGEVLKYLRGLRYPAEKSDLTEQARRNQAPEDVLRAIEIMYPEIFSNPNDVERNLKSSEARDQSATQRHQQEHRA